MSKFKNPEIEALYHEWLHLSTEVSLKNGESFELEKYSDLMVRSWPFFFEMMCNDNAVITRDYVFLYYMMCEFSTAVNTLSISMIDNEEFHMPEELSVAQFFHAKLLGNAEEQTFQFDDNNNLLVRRYALRQDSPVYKIDPNTFDLSDFI